MKSEKHKYLNTFLLGSVILIITLGQTFAKTGSNYLKQNIQFEGILFIILGYAMLMFRGVIWIVILKRMKLSVAYPAISIAYILIPLVGYFIFGESLSLTKLSACLFIFTGVLLTAKK